MPELAASILKGNWSGLTITGRRIRRRGDGLDSGVVNFATTVAVPFTIGQAISAIPGMYVDDVDSVEDGGGVYEHAVNCSGLLGTTFRQVLGYPDPKINIDDWDTVEDEVLSTNPHYFRKGQFGTYGGTTVCISANAKPANYSRTIFRVKGSFKGIVESKGYRRTVTCNGQTISGDSITVPLENGWNTARKGVASLPKIVVTDTYLATSPPPTQNTPGTLVPPAAPPIRLLTFSGADVTSHWPSGWVFTTGYRKMPDVALYENDWIYEWTPKFTP